MPLTVERSGSEVELLEIPELRGTHPCTTHTVSQCVPPSVFLSASAYTAACLCMLMCTYVCRCPLGGTECVFFIFNVISVFVFFCFCAFCEENTHVLPHALACLWCCNCCGYGLECINWGFSPTGYNCQTVTTFSSCLVSTGLMSSLVCFGGMGPYLPRKSLTSNHPPCQITQTRFAAALLCLEFQLGVPAGCTFENCQPPQLINRGLKQVVEVAFCPEWCLLLISEKILKSLFTVVK